MQFEDGSIKAQLGLPDMRLPIQYALGFPRRLKSNLPRFDFKRFPAFNFESPDTETFRNLALAYHALERGGNMPCVLNAANEIAVGAFLEDRIGFMEMFDLVEQCLAKSDYIREPVLDDYVTTDREVRRMAEKLV